MVMVESSKAVGPWREAVRGEVQRAAPVPLPGPVHVEITFRLTRPAGHFGTGRNAGQLKPTAPLFPNSKKNDIDKLARSTLDGLTMGGAYWDDGQVVELVARKVYGEQAGACITVEPMKEGE